MPLAVENVSFAYRPGRPVLREVSLALQPGSVTAVIGPNGAGKSTLLRLMAGVLAPSSGSVQLDGREVASLPSRARAHRLGYLAQRPALAFAYTVRQFIALGRYAAGGGPGDRAVDAALERTGLSDREGELFGALSAGQQQRAALARILAQLDGIDASVFLADEPVSAMDPRHALATMAILRSLASAGAAVAVVLHDLTLAARWADHALVLARDGRTARAGPAADSLTPPVLEPVFDVRFDTLGSGPSRALIAAAPSRSQ